MSFFRYPGGKSKLKNQIAKKLNEVASDDNLEYREPFFGGGSIGLLVLEKRPNLKKIWINDFDLGISSLWTTLINRPDLLKSRVLKFKPSIEAFDNYKIELTQCLKLKSDTAIADFGFKKLAIHQISYSGLGTKSGGPLGGRDQKSDYKIDCRWSPNYICKKIDALHDKFSKLDIRESCCTNLDFSELIEDNRYDAVIYLDPPYYDKVNDLYQHGFEEVDHNRLANCLKKTKHQWILSYDDCEGVRKYYQDWSDIDSIDGINYSITATKDKITGERLSRSKSELLIIPSQKASNVEKHPTGIVFRKLRKI